MASTFLGTGTRVPAMVEVPGSTAEGNLNEPLEAHAVAIATSDDGALMVEGTLDQLRAYFSGALTEIERLIRLTRDADEFGRVDVTGASGTVYTVPANVSRASWMEESLRYYALSVREPSARS